MAFGRGAVRSQSFTQKNLLKLPLPDSGRQDWHDTKTPGLIVTVAASGSRTFYVYHRLKGRPARLSLGKVGEITLDDARKAAKATLGDDAKGVDVQKRRKRQRRGKVTFGQVWDLYLESYAKPRKRSWDVDRRRYDRRLAVWAHRPLSSISTQRAQALINEIAETGGKVEANRCRSLIRLLFTFARKQFKYPGRSPVEDISPFPETSRERFLHADEMPRFFAALRDLRTEYPDPADVVELALLTGARRQNVLEMEWAEVNLERGEWVIPKEKYKAARNITIPLLDEALAILNHRAQHRKSERWVFPGLKPGRPIRSIEKSWNNLLASAGIKDFHIHDLRRTAGSWMAGSGASLPVIGKALGHTSPASTAIYARLDLSPIREAMQKATAAIQAAAKGGQDSGAVQN